MILYPTSDEYLVAVQQPSTFRRPELARAVFDRHPVWDIPSPASGSSAVVFKADIDGEPQALRFFIREDASTRDRYTALNAYFREHDLTASVATCQWLDDAIALNGRTWPMVQMQWVDGRTLDLYVADLVERGDRHALETLAGNWRLLLRSMQGVGFAHGDLQHGNVMVDQAGALRLVDFDGAWIAPFAGQAEPGEYGHPNYQRRDRPWGPLMDTFPGLVVYASLMVLARDRTCWKLHDGNNLIFNEQDFRSPGHTEVWQRAAGIPDPQVQQVVSRLGTCCAAGWAPTGQLETLIRGPGVRFAEPPRTGPVPTAPTRTQPPAGRPWWELTGSVPVPTPDGPGSLPPPPRIPTRIPTGPQTLPPIAAPSGQWNPGQPPGKGTPKVPTTGGPPGGRPWPPPPTSPDQGTGRRTALAVLLSLLIGLGAAFVLAATGLPGSAALLVGIVAAAAAFIPLIIDATRAR